jgi:signal transduction histidine kinase/putative methionine-R-sulfoxide reductase with GAF domain
MPQSIDNQKLVKIMHKMIQCNDANDLLKTLLEGAIDLICSRKECYGWVGRLNRTNGKIIIIAQTKALGTVNRKEMYGSGIAGQSLANRKLRNVGSVDSLDGFIHVEYWKETKSIIAIPIMVENARVLQREDVAYRSKPLGILNIESSRINKFNQEVEETFLLLCSHAGEILDKIDRAMTLESLYQIEKNILEEERSTQTVIRHDDIMNKLVKDIYEKLFFNFINISWIDTNRKNVESIYMYCHDYSDNDLKEFYKKAKHSLDSTDIQADIIRCKKIDIPTFDDPRFDKEIRSTFGHDRYIRAFLPIINPSSNLTDGTLEVGYPSFNKYMYEADILSLDRIVNLISKIMERKRVILINNAIHNIKSPLVGIRANASFLCRHAAKLTCASVQEKSNDISNDCELLKHHINRIEYALTGRLSRPPKKTDVNIYNEIIAKSIDERKNKMANFKLHYKAIPESLQQAVATTDIPTLLDVIYNLFENAEKYCKSFDDKANEIFICMKEEMNTAKYGDNIYIYFQDRGIGINPKYKDEIFKHGFRDPAVVRKINGSGLGLTISKDLMCEIGGDLELVSCANPTSFKLTIPKRNRI